MVFGSSTIYVTGIHFAKSEYLSGFYLPYQLNQQYAVVRACIVEQSQESFGNGKAF